MFDDGLKYLFKQPLTMHSYSVIIWLSDQWVNLLIFFFSTQREIIDEEMAL